MRTRYQALLWVTISSGLTAQAQDVVVSRIGAGSPGALNTFNFVAGELLGGSPVKSAPYSAEAATESTQTLADGNRIVNHSSAMVYRDGEGRERREQTLPRLGPFAAQGEPPKTIFISDPVAGVSYSLDPVNKVAVKLPAPKAPPLPPLPKAGDGGGGSAQVFVKRIEGPGAGAGVTAGIVSSGANMMFLSQGSGAAAAPKREQLGSKVIAGVSADGTRTTITIAAGQIGNDKAIEIVDEMWRSPELQVIVESTHSDPRMGTTLYSLKNISRAAPSPSLFQVPPDYTIKDAPVFNTPVPPPPVPRP